MKKKVLYGVFMALFAFATIGTLQSCKDDLSDLKRQEDYNLSTLQSQLKIASDNLKKLIDANTDSIGRHLAWLKANSDAIKANSDSIDQVARDVKDLEESLADYAKVEWVSQLLYGEGYDPADVQNVIDNGGLMPMITGALESIRDLNKYCDDLQAEVDNLKNTLGSEEQPLTVLGRIKALEVANTTINQTLQKLAANDQALLDAFGVADNDALKTKVQKLLNDIYDADGNSNIAALKARLDVLEPKVTALENEFNELISYIKANVTGILIQGTDNPLFGNFSLPIGVKSNMLFNWYGISSASEAYTFPTDGAEFSADNNAVDGTALAALDPATVNIGARGSYIGAEEGISLGKVYLTINPTTEDFTGKTFTLETSAGNKLPYALKVKKSNDELAFGYTSRAAENGFYEAEVFMPKDGDAINATDIQVTQSLESAMKEVVNGGSKKTAAIDILKTMYGLMSGKLKAYGVRYDWDYTLGGATTSAAVLSQYDLAVATAQPLGFNFLEGKGTSRKVPTFGNVDNFLDRLNKKINGKFTFKNKNITIKGKSIAFADVKEGNVVVKENPAYMPSIVDGRPNPEFDATKHDPNNKLIITINGLQVGGKSVGTLETKCEEPEGVTEAVNKKLVEAIYAALNPTDVDVNGEVAFSDDVLKGQIVAQCDVYVLEIQKEVNSAINDITARATSSVNNAINKVRKHSDRLQQLVDLYNKVADKLSEVLANPNNYLQVAAVYKTNDGFGLLSNDPYSPTQMSAGSGLHLLLTTYTAELIAPTYKKYIAVTGVNGKTDGIKDLNTGDVLNTVLDGNQIDAVIPVDGWKAGNVYELTYQAVDYKGYTSTRKFYIQVI